MNHEQHWIPEILGRILESILVETSTPEECFMHKQDIIFNDASYKMSSA